MASSHLQLRYVTDWHLGELLVSASLFPLLLFSWSLSVVFLIGEGGGGRECGANVMDDGYGFQGRRCGSLMCVIGQHLEVLESSTCDQLEDRLETQLSFTIGKACFGCEYNPLSYYNFADSRPSSQVQYFTIRPINRLPLRTAAWDGELDKVHGRIRRTAYGGSVF